MAMKNEFGIRASKSRYNISGDNIELFCFQSGDGGYYTAQPLSLKQTSQVVEALPFCTISKNEAQVLMDDLWQTGLRPSEGTGSAGSLKATQQHLADMKKILFHKLGIKD